MKEGIRRVVRVISALAWVVVIIGVALSFVYMHKAQELAAGFSMTAVAFAVLQGLAWILAGFSGNSPPNDGIVRPWTWFARKKQAPAPIPTQSAGWRWGSVLIGVIAWGIGYGIVKEMRRPDPVDIAAKAAFSTKLNQEIFKREMRPVMNMPEFQAAIRNAKTGDDAQSITADLVRRGMPKLPEYLLVRRLGIYLALLNKSDVNFCAKIARGINTTTDGKKLLSIMESLPESDVAAWMQISAAAIQTELKNLPVSPLSDQRIQVAFESVTSNFSQQQLVSLENLIFAPQTVNDTSACQVAKDLYKAALNAPPDIQRTMARAVVME